MQTQSKMATKLLKAALFAQVGAASNCFGNGACTNNECQCDAGWKGPDCSTLDVNPARTLTLCPAPATKDYPQPQS